MSSLTIEMGLRRKRGNSPEMPEQLASRDDVTLAQKQRLAMLAKMGLGPVGGSGSAAASRSSAVVPAASEPAYPPAMDRRQQMLEKERRFREEQERQEAAEEAAEMERLQKTKAKSRGGMQRLGPVLAREEDIPQFPPAPAQVPEPKSSLWENPPPAVRPKPGQMQLKISQDMADRVKAAAPEAKEDKKEEESSSDDDDGDANDVAKDVLAQIALQKKAAAAKAEKKRQEEERKKAGKKKKRKRGRDDDEGDDGAYDEDDRSEDEYARYDQVLRDVSASSKPAMVVESVKGKVSLANKGMTDADLERRFLMQDSRNSGSLMTEEQVLKMIRREKTDKGGASNEGSAARRVQRELAEWAAAKEQQRQRVKSPHRFERMVVARK